MLTIILAIIAILLLIALLYLNLIKPEIAESTKLSPLMGHYYAHRGFHDNRGDAPENSLLSFRRAAEKGYGIELDVQLSSDGEVVVFHDDTTDRICGVDRKVSECSFAELGEMSLLSTKQNVPLLSEALSVVAGRVPIVVELKPYGDKTALCVAVNRVLSKYDGVYCIESFHPDIVTWYRHNRPDVIRGQLSAGYNNPLNPKFFVLSYLLTNFKARPNFIAYDHAASGNLSFNICRTLFRATTVAWTIKSQDQLNRARKKFDLFIFEGFIPEE